jgi:hypothetical protein
MAEVSTTPTLFQPGFRLIDGTDLNKAIAGFSLSTDSGVTASTVQTRAGAKQLTQAITSVTTSAASDAVKLPASGAGALNMLVVFNESGQTVQVFPGGANDIIDGGTAGAAVNLGNNKGAIFACVLEAGGVRTWMSLAAAKSS